MKFDEFDRKMRVYETELDHCVAPGVYVVVRLDGRNFTTLTKVAHTFEAPFDERFRDLMTDTAKHLFDCGFNVVYGFSQSDEIFLLLAHNDDTFGRKTRKMVSVLAGEASARFTLSLSSIGVFDARVSLLPTLDDVVDYFRWRREDACRNALNAHCYWMLRGLGKDAHTATCELDGMNTAGKKELLRVNGVEFKDLPQWHKYGIGLYWDAYSVPGYNPMNGTHTVAQRRQVKIDTDLPAGSDHDTFITNLARV